MSECGVDVSGECRLQSILGNMSMSPLKWCTKDTGQRTGQGITGNCTRKYIQAPGSSCCYSHLYNKGNVWTYTVINM